MAGFFSIAEMKLSIGKKILNVDNKEEVKDIFLWYYM